MRAPSLNAFRISPTQWNVAKKTVLKKDPPPMLLPPPPPSRKNHGTGQQHGGGGGYEYQISRIPRISRIPDQFTSHTTFAYNKLKISLFMSKVEPFTSRLQVHNSDGGRTHGGGAASGHTPTPSPSRTSFRVGGGGGEGLGLEGVGGSQEGGGGRFHTLIYMA